MSLDPDEPKKVAEAVKLLGLRYVVLTSVARDDLPDGGASWFVKVMDEVRKVNPKTQIEVLTPDFGTGKDAENQQALRVATVVGAKPACYNHNVETVPRLQNPVRRGGKYERSLRVLDLVKEFDDSIPTKIGFNVGFGRNQGGDCFYFGGFEGHKVRSHHHRSIYASVFGSFTCGKILDS